MLAQPNPRETPRATPLGPGSLSLDPPFGALTLLPAALSASLVHPRPISTALPGQP
jgi:hypothetical protein